MMFWIGLSVSRHPNGFFLMKRQNKERTKFLLEIIRYNNRSIFSVSQDQRSISYEQKDCARRRAKGREVYGYQT